MSGTVASRASALVLALLAWAGAAAAGPAGAAGQAEPSTFARVQSRPVLDTTTGFYDDYMTASPSVVRDHGVLHMVYTGHCQKPAGYTPLLPSSRTCPEDAGIFLLGATSEDGTHWRKEPKPILRPLPSARWMSDGVSEAELVRGPDGWFYLFFTGLGFPESRAIGVARSHSPFGPWDVNPRPILRGAFLPPFGNHKVLAPSVSIEPRRDRVLMWFNGTNQLELGWDIFVARSDWPLRSGGRWARWVPANGGERAVVGPYDAGSGDPTVVREDGSYHMFFTCGSPQFDGPPGICQATSRDGLRFSAAPELHALRPRANAWDQNLETAFALPRRRGGYRMYYAGYSDRGYAGTAIGLAVADGL